MIKFSKVSKARDCYCKYPGQFWPQPAYVQLTEEGEVSCDHSGEVGNGVPAYVYHGRTRRYPVSPATHALKLAKWLKLPEQVALLERIHNGLDVNWDGNNMSGRLNTDAEQASSLFTVKVRLFSECNLIKVLAAA